MKQNDKLFQVFNQKPKVSSKISSVSQSSNISLQKKQVDTHSDKLCTPTLSKIEPSNNSDSTKEKQLQQLKIMELSEECKLALKRVQRYTNKLYPQQVQQICREVLKLQTRRLQKVKNANKDMRMLFWDNELTVTVLCHEMRAISQLNEEITQLKKYKQLWEKQESKKKERQFRQKLESKSNPSQHRQNVLKQMKNSMNQIKDFIEARQNDKALNHIKNFIKKYQKQDFAIDQTQLYKIIQSNLGDYKNMDQCLKQISKILWTLSMADLDKKNECLRALKSNHKQFNILKHKYYKDEKPYEKKMLNILKHLQDFNDNIVNYLQTSNQLEIKKDELQKSRSQLKVEYETRLGAQLSSVQKKYKQERQKSARKDNQSTKLSFQNHLLDDDSINLTKIKENNAFFSKKISLIINKMDKNLGWYHDFDVLMKDKKFIAFKPFSDFFLFEQASRRYYEHQIKNQVKNFEAIIGQMKTIFKKQKMKHQNRFKQISKVLQLSGKKQPHLYQLNRELQLLMIAIVERSQEQNQKIHIQILEYQQNKLKKQNNQLSASKDRYRIAINHLSETNKELSRSRSKQGSRSMSNNPLGVNILGDSRLREKQQNHLQQRDICQKLETFLNKSLQTMFKQTSVDSKIFQIEKSFSTAVKKHPYLKKILQVVNNWLKFMIKKFFKEGENS